MARKPNDYLNFDLLITQTGDGYRAYVVNAPGGDADVRFELPFSADEIGRLVHGDGTRRGVRLVEDNAPPPVDLHALGEQLYVSVFREEVRSVFVASQTSADEQGQHLRIRLRFSDDAVDLATLPWEILFDPEQQCFLALAEARPILRYLSLPRLFFRCLFVFVLIEHASRRIVHVAVTAHPTDFWVAQQLRKATS